MTRVVQVLLTITSLEFFGPILRDYSPSHAFNPTWVGHARVHLVWLLGFMFFSGLANLYLIWLRRPREIRNLWLSVPGSTRRVANPLGACRSSGCAHRRRANGARF